MPPPPLSGPLRLRKQRALLVLIGVLFGSWTIWATLVLPRLGSVEGPEHELRSIAIRLLLWVLPAGVYLWHQHRKRALVPLRLNFPPTPQRWFAVVFISVAASVAVSLDVARKLDVPLGEVWQRCFASLTWHFPTAPVFEELIFRGVILAELLVVFGAEPRADVHPTFLRLRAWLANIAATVVFTGLHWPWWIYTHGMTQQFWINTAGVSLISLVLGMLFIHGRSLWPCIVLHWLNNSLSALAP